MPSRELTILRIAALVWAASTVSPAGARQPVVELPLPAASIGHRIEFVDLWPTSLFDDPELWEELPSPVASPPPVIAPAPLIVQQVPPPPTIEEVPGAGVTPDNLPAPDGWLVEEAFDPPPAKQPMIGFELHRDATTWLVGNGDDFGFYSLEGVSTVKIGQLEGLFSGYSAHFVGGPVQTDMPPRLFELFMGYRAIGDMNATWGYDLTVSAGIYTDFEGHAHQGWRIRGVGLAKYRHSPTTTAVFGVAYLDRENIKLLPVGGLVIELSEFTTLELVFPEPRLSTAISFGTDGGHSQLYVRGQFGGGSWAIERDSLSNDIATYEDLRAFLGVTSEGDDGKSTYFEVGYVFNRGLEYRSGSGDMDFNDTLMIRSGIRY